MAAIDAVWRIESARIVATLTRMVGDVSLAEDLAQEAVADALTQWPESGVPLNPGAWLTAVAKRKAIDGWRRRERLDERYSAIARDLSEADASASDEWEPIGDDVLRLMFVACHPALSREAQVALTLRIVGGLTTGEIARLFLLPVATVQQRIVRAKRSLGAAKVPFETPDPSEWTARLKGVLAVIYLIFTEGYAATSGDRWLRSDLAAEALRLGRALSSMLPREPEVLGLVALMELQSSRFAAREAADGTPILLADQDRRRWDRSAILRGRTLLARADALGKGRGTYCLQAAIAERHAVATSVANTDWPQIVLLYEVLGRIAPSPIVELNRAVAVSMATGPASALAIVDRLGASGALAGGPLLASVRGELLVQLGRVDEARSELLVAIQLSGNEQQRRVLQGKLDALGA
ncbi:RNA polymerase subunit sigma-24 [Pseudoclavibacter sp. RFBJ3]|uniref:RNA polymerase sigma factor n=1 Tax=unclassified Pseudoclavibacter TaxID=2615177 RepID=UPI000CE9014B|nr:MULTISPECIES: RNA polymerase sigma factor [unclassified Pseudoclavibacter]PPF84452.1 RNA polymerase subunit sigma-24 [Pseudoclavibacter sp. RFBJ5]PPF92936.1 RNA polymerase subunit sigma-24 [Pseudoclavibacter sp. RFBJ3]PPF98280.1 RNA polymerase subunit sigma-24 [Pseudoclavibacter sp. RFBH5]PPG25350.1 RNA polymerase subunit sigma-24 [Pseudoclavibacter sp. RFBI4]